MRWIQYFLALALASASGVAFAEQVTGVGSTFDTFREASSTGTSDTNCVAGDGEPCRLFPASNKYRKHSAHLIVQTSGSGAATLCWSHNAGGAITSDATADSQTCFRLYPSIKPWAYAKPFRQFILRGTDGAGTGAISGLCSTAVDTSNGDSLYAPCASASDCSSYGGGTCTAEADQTPEQKRDAGAFLLLESATAETTSVSVMSEEALR